MVLSHSSVVYRSFSGGIPSLTAGDIQSFTSDILMIFCQLRHSPVVFCHSLLVVSSHSQVTYSQFSYLSIIDCIQSFTSVFGHSSDILFQLSSYLWSYRFMVVQIVLLQYLIGRKKFHCSVWIGLEMKYAYFREHSVNCKFSEKIGACNILCGV